MSSQGNGFAWLAKNEICILNKMKKSVAKIIIGIAVACLIIPSTGYAKGKRGKGKSTSIVRSASKPTKNHVSKYSASDNKTYRKDDSSKKSVEKVSGGHAIIQSGSEILESGGSTSKISQPNYLVKNAEGRPQEFHQNKSKSTHKEEDCFLGQSNIIPAGKVNVEIGGMEKNLCPPKREIKSGNTTPKTTETYKIKEVESIK